jgi:kynurenine formamidase
MGQRVFDLSQELFSGMQVFDLHSPTHILPWAKLEASGFRSEAIFCNGHAGTHVDAPYHFLKEGRSIEQIPLDRFFGPAIVYDLTHLHPKGRITRAHLEQLSTTEIAPEQGDIVLLRTGIDSYLGRPEYLSDYSGLSEEGAAFLADRGVKAVGTDAASIDHPEEAACPVHNLLFPKEILIYENLANLEPLLEAARGKRFAFTALPLKIRQGTGSPVRAMAVVD